MATLAATRVRDDAVDVRWVLFIDGIAYAWTTDTGQGGGGTLRGSGASSWIGLSEDAIGGVETIGARTVLGGLEVPGSIRLAVDVKAGELEPNPVTFRLHDIDGVLGPLFAREGKAYDVLRSRVAPGLTATAATAVGPGGGAIGLWGRNVGIERIGAAGERRLFPALPFDLVGFDHAVHQDAPLPGELPPVLVSDDPLAWAGRLVTLYEIYRDPDSTATTAAAWPTWDDQHTAGNLVWWGVVRGVSRQRGRVFELDCHGPDALLRKQLGTFTTDTWTPVTAEINYGTGEDTIAIVFSAQYPGGAIPVDFDGSIFDRTLTATTKGGLITEINGFIQDVIDGTSTNFAGSAGQLDAWSEGGLSQDAAAGLDGEIYLRKRDMAADQSMLVLRLAMHSRVWRALGYEPETQNFDPQHTAPDDDRQIRFIKLANGASFSTSYDTGEDVPAAGYWVARMTTVALGFTEETTDSNDWDNNGNQRRYAPKFTSEVFTLDMSGGGQIVRLGGAEAPYIEGQHTVYHDGEDVDGAASERARFFAFRGKVAARYIQRVGTGAPASEQEPDVVDTVQVGLFEWAEGSHGTVSVGASGVQPALRLVRWMDPRLFGFNHKRLDVEYWAGTSGAEGEAPIEAVPLHAYAYLLDDSPEYAHSVLTQVMLSTGSGSGYDPAGTITAGDNSMGALAGPLFFGDDLEIADMGLAIPNQLMAPLAEIRDAFDTVPGGWAGPLNRVRYAYAGPFLAQDLTGSLLRARRLTWRLHGGAYGVTRLAPFSPDEADAVILERDLYPVDPGDPRSLMPEQTPAPLGHLDGVRLGYRWDPNAAKLALEHVERAKDPDARGRTGELVEALEEHGLMPWPWGLPATVGTTPWYDEIRQLWGYEAAAFFALDHSLLRLNVSRPKGQDLWPGSRVRITNPWPVDSDGSFGLTDRVALVTAVEIDTSTHARMVEAFVFAGQSNGLTFFAPMARILSQTGAALTISTDQYGHGNADLYDGHGFVEPSWSSVGGAAAVTILYRVGETWTISELFDVVSYAAGVLTLSGAPSTSIAYADRWVLFSTHGDQDSAGFVRELFGWYVLDDLTESAGPTLGKPFL